MRTYNAVAPRDAIVLNRALASQKTACWRRGAQKCKEKRRRSFSLVARGCVTLIARSVGGSNQCFGGSLIHPPTAGSGYLKESELENQAGSRYLEKKNWIVKLRGMSTSKPAKNLRVSGKNLWFFPGYFQVLFLCNFFCWVGAGAESFSPPVACLYAWADLQQRTGRESKDRPNTGSNPAEVITPTGYQYQQPFYWYPWPRPRARLYGLTLHWNILATGLTLH